MRSFVVVLLTILAVVLMLVVLVLARIWRNNRNITEYQISPPETGLVKGLDLAELKSFADIFREMIKHENDLVNHRMTWMITLQTFLVFSMSILWGKVQNDLPILLVAFLGFGVCLSSFIALRAANKSISNMQDEWRNLLAAEPADKERFKIIGLGKHDLARNKFWSEVQVVLLPWNFLPLLFLIVWTTVAFLAGNSNIILAVAPITTSATYPSPKKAPPNTATKLREGKGEKRL